MNSRTNAPPGRSQRDELEQLQSELREARRQREVLPRETAELASRVERLEQEVSWLRRTLAVAGGEASRPAPSLPDQLVLPFLVHPSQQVRYRRQRMAVLLVLLALAPLLYLAPWGERSTRASLANGLMLVVGFMLMPLLRDPRDSAQALAWRFDEEGLARLGPGAPSGKILYREIHHVETAEAGPQPLLSHGSLSITWLPGVTTSLGKPATFPLRRVELEQIDDSVRLADWLRDRVQQAREERKAGTHVS